ncbi:MAG: hypothetical protein JO041_10150 [Acidobacteria bacterium]|nr:hypothetical protein [Acidobacteriota bacterium]
MKRKKLFAAVCLIGFTTPLLASSAPKFEVVINEQAAAAPVTGRLIVVLAKKADPEPRLTIAPAGPAIYAVDVNHLAPGQASIIDENSVGYPMPLGQLPAGEYFAQAILNVYSEFHRSDGHTVWVHMGDGRVEVFQIAPGNLYSEVTPVQIGAGGTVRLQIAHVIPPSPAPPDTAWLKHIKIQSKLLSEFWGHPVFIHATVLLPKAYDEHPNARYPLVFPLGHNVPFSFSPDPQSGGRSDRAATGLESGYEFFQAWNSEGFPRVIAVTLEQATPYFPDSYSVNSANNGPYGDAIVQEVIPYLEQHFRAIGKPYARILEGASTSGWQTLALQLQHPEVFGGAWVLQPDPIDFRHYQLVNIYKDENAFSIPTGPLTSTERPFRRTVEGQVAYTVRELSLFEEVLGTKGRSGFQLEAWEAVYGPAGADGYPVPLWDKLTGKIDRNVADSMRDRGFDLRDYAERHWAEVGPKITGKLHFFCGDMDNFYLNLAVYDFQNFLKTTTNPHYEAEFTFGRPEKGHAWHAWTWAEMVRQMAAYIEKNAPAGENGASWKY